MKLYTSFLFASSLITATFISSCCDDNSDSNPNNEGCIQCTVKDSTSASLLLDNEICGTEQDLNDYKTALTDSNQILCGDIRVVDYDQGAQTVYTEFICHIQSGIDVAIIEINDDRGCGTCGTYFNHEYSLDPVLDCERK